MNKSDEYMRIRVTGSLSRAERGRMLHPNRRREGSGNLWDSAWRTRKGSCPILKAKMRKFSK